MDIQPVGSRLTISISFLRYGHHACTQNSSLGLTNALYNLTITSLLLKLIFLFIIPRTIFAFFAARIHCSVDLPVRSITTPRSLSVVELLITLFPNLYSYSL